jgi:molybdate transport system ATP-binding protein
MAFPEIALRAKWQRHGFTLDVDLSTRSHVLGIVGPSGSGKSSIIEIVSGRTDSADAELRFGDELWQSAAKRVHLRPDQRGLGLMPQDGLLFPHLDVRGNLIFGAHRGPRNAPSVVDALASRLGIREFLDRPVSTLSGGQRQRVALGRALLSHPRWLLLDEPLGALDYARRRSLLPLLRSVVDESRVPLWIVSHDRAEITALCEEVLVIENGRIIDQGPPERVFGKTMADPETYSENLLRGIVDVVDDDKTIVRLGGGTRFVCRRSTARQGDAVFVSLFASDIMLSPQIPERLSASNIHEAEVLSLPPAVKGMVELRIVPNTVLWAHLTTRAIAALELAVGSRVYVVFKATSVQVWSP